MVTPSPLRRLNVLVIDDEPFILEYVRKVLHQAGYATFLAENADQALARFEERKGEIDLVLTDIVMPDSIDGLELAARIHRIEPTVPILFITGAIPQDDPHMLSLMNGGFLLRKPFFPDQLIRFVENQVEHLHLAV
ncbi:MAG TPA: response regulator [Chthoniobacterales bacterium]|jgi:CheY-like chemotaxis protein|nr:response regulator [Chthoniobacterales bacterium]